MKPSLFNTAIIKKARLPWIDYARGIAIFLVLYRHIFEGIKRSGIDVSHFANLEHANIIFFSFRMPLFFIVSGVFVAHSLTKRGLQEFIKNKWKLLLYPYLLWAVIQITLQLILSKYVNADRSYKDYYYIIFYPREIDQFWYLYTLFNVGVLYAITRVKLKVKPTVQLVAGIIMFLTSSLLVQHSIHVGFVYDILHYYIFFAIGDLISSFILNKDNYKYFASWKTFFIVLPIFACCQLYFLQQNLLHGKEGRYSYVEDFHPIQFLFIALSGCVFMANISFILQKYGKGTWLRVIGYHSLYIYLLHVLVSSAVRIFLTKVMGISYPPLLLVVGVTFGLIIPIVFYNVAMKYNLWWLFSLEKPRKENLTPKNLSLV